MERVPQDEAVRHWLRVERQKARDRPAVAVGDERDDDPRAGVNEDPGDDTGGSTAVPVDVAELDPGAALDELLQRKPGAAAFVWRDAPVDWFRIELSIEAFLGLHVVAGPARLYWRALSPDDTVRAAAERIRRADPDELAAETGVDVAKVLALRDAMPGAADRALVLSTRRGCVPWTIADGNYRAVAKAMYLLDDGAYAPQSAYLGVGANPVATPLRERLCGWLRRALSRRSSPVWPASSRRG